MSRFVLKINMLQFTIVMKIKEKQKLYIYDLPENKYIFKYKLKLYGLQSDSTVF